VKKSLGNDFVEKLREAVASGMKPPLTITASDGTQTLLADQSVIDIFLSQAPEPGQAALDLVFAGATAVRVHHLERMRTSVVLETDDPADLHEVHESLRLKLSQRGWHLMSIPTLVLEILGADGVRARLDILPNWSIRWDGTWGSDADLQDDARLLRWFASKGFTAPNG
jgi:hypothetical protein